MIKKLSYTGFAAATLLLSGCQILPNFQSPKAPIPEKFATPISEAPAAVDIGWREFFQNPELQQVIEQALVNNRDLKATALHRRSQSPVWHTTR